MNKKAIVTRSKKKLRTGMAVFNKKLGIYEYQIKEGGKIILREPVDEMNARHKQEVGNWKATSMRDRAQATLQANASKKSDS